MHNILSIQSHVAYGYVGNRAAVFPLQRMGCEVMAVNTVQFSNHTGYDSWKGMVFSPAHIRDVIDGIDAQGALAKCHALLTGYLGSAELGQVVLETAMRIKHANPDAIYCCDPVMGDTGPGIYVRDDIPPFFQEQLIHVADIITPNQFELSCLTGCDSITTLSETRAACKAVRDKGPGVVLVSSLTHDNTAPDAVEMLIDSDTGTWLIRTPWLNLNPQPNGAGDCLAALFLGHYLKTGRAETALKHAASALFTLLEHTKAAGTRELALISAQNAMLDPEHVFEIEYLD